MTHSRPVKSSPSTAHATTSPRINLRVMDDTPRRTVLALAAALALAGLIAYSGTFNGPFVFDDYGHIVTAENIRRLWPISSWLLDNPRPVVTLTLAVNYFLNGASPVGYHVVNLLIHLLAGVVLFALMRRVLTAPAIRHVSWAIPPHWLAFAVALLWMVHPLQTQSVTYIIQRSESLMGLFFLLSAWCFVRGMDSPRAASWRIASVLAFALGMGCKVAIVGGPLFLLAMDRLLYASTFREILQQRWRYYLGLVLAAALVIFGTKLHLSIFHPDPGFNVTVGLGTKGLTPWQYLSSQPGVVLHYLGLVFWPRHLCIDYGWGLPPNAAGVILPAIPIVLLMGVTLWGFWKRRAWALPGVWFFLLLGPSSSIIPVRDLIMEHRMYLPLAGVLTAVVLGMSRLLPEPALASIGVSTRRRAAAGLLAVLTCLLIARTIARNRDYQDIRELWAATLRVNPLNSRAWLNFGEALARDNLNEDALKAFEQAAALSPRDFAIHYNLGNSYVQAGRTADAERAYLKSIELNGDELPARIMLGNLYASQKDDARAEEMFRGAIARATPQTDRNTLAKAHYNLANSLFRMVRPNDAYAHYRRAAEIDPNYDKARFGLGWILARFGRTEEAIRELTEALRINPANLEAREELQRLMQDGSAARP